MRGRGECGGLQDKVGLVIRIRSCRLSIFSQAGGEGRRGPALRAAVDTAEGYSVVRSSKNPKSSIPYSPLPTKTSLPPSHPPPRRLPSPLHTVPHLPPSAPLCPLPPHQPPDIRDTPRPRPRPGARPRACLASLSPPRLPTNSTQALLLSNAELIKSSASVARQSLDNHERLDLRLYRVRDLGNYRVHPGCGPVCEERHPKARLQRQPYSGVDCLFLPLDHVDYCMASAVASDHKPDTRGKGCLSWVEGTAARSRRSKEKEGSSSAAGSFTKQAQAGRGGSASKVAHPRSITKQELFSLQFVRVRNQISSPHSTKPSFRPGL